MEHVKSDNIISVRNPGEQGYICKVEIFVANMHKLDKASVKLGDGRLLESDMRQAMLEDRIKFEGEQSVLATLIPLKPFEIAEVEYISHSDAEIVAYSVDGLATQFLIYQQSEDCEFSKEKFVDLVSELKGQGAEVALYNVSNDVFVKLNIDNLSDQPVCHMEFERMLVTRYLDY